MAASGCQLLESRGFAAPRAAWAACAVVAVVFGLQHSRVVVVRFRAVQPFLLFGVMLSSQQGFRSSLSFTVLACTSGSGRGSWLLQVQANLVALRVLPMLQNGVSVLGSRWAGSACFALALQVAVALFRGSTFRLLCLSG